VLVAGNRRRNRGGSGVRGRSSSSHGGRPGGLGRWLRFGPDDVDAALKVGAVFDHDTGRLHIAHQVGPGPQRDALVGVNISFDGARDDHFLGLDASFYFALRANGQAVIHLQLTAQFSIYNDFFVTRERPLNAQGLANDRD